MGWSQADESLINTNKWLEENGQEAADEFAATRERVEKLYAAAEAFDESVNALGAGPANFVNDLKNALPQNQYGTYEKDANANEAFTYNTDFEDGVNGLFGRPGGPSEFDQATGQIPSLDRYGNLNYFVDGVDAGFVTDVPAVKNALHNLKSELNAVRDQAQKISQLSAAYEAAKQSDINAAGMGVGVGDNAMMAAAMAGLTPDQVREAQKAKEDIKAAADAAGSLGARIRSGNYLSRAFREQCFIQANMFKLIELQGQEQITSGIALPYVGGPGAVAGDKSRTQDQPTNKAVQANLEPFGFMNLVAQSPSVGTLFEAPTEVISQLQPMPRFYKVLNSDPEAGEKGLETDVQIIFPSATRQGDVESVFKNKNQRGYGVGVKSFEWTYDGSNPFAVKKSIKATLKIYAVTMAELLRDRGGYRYADLALKTGQIPGDEHPRCGVTSRDVRMSSVNSLDFRLKAVVGYETPHNLGLARHNISKYQGAIHDSYVTLELTPVIHSFDFDENGQVIFTIEYLAYIEDFFDDYYYNIFPTPEGLARKIAMMMTDTTSGAEEQSYDSDVVKKEHIAALSHLIGTLFNDDLIYYLRVPWAKMRAATLDPMSVLPVFNTSGELANPNQVATEVQHLNQMTSNPRIGTDPDAIAGAKDTLEGLKAIGATNHPSETYGQMGFIYLIDLVNAIMTNIESFLASGGPELLDKKSAEIGDKGSSQIIDKERRVLSRMYDNYRKLRVVLGPLEIRRPISATSMAHSRDFHTVTMGSIPISLNYFIEWMTSKMLSKDRVGYTLSAFINDFIKSYLRNFLNNTSCRGDSYSQTVSLFSANVSSYSATKERDELTEIITHNPDWEHSWGIVMTPFTIKTWKSQSGGLTPLLNTMGSRIAAGPNNPGQQHQKNYMIFYAGRTQPREMMTGNKTLDHSRGIFHYILGKERGLVKNIRLDRVEVKGQKEMRFEQEGYDGLSQLREVYNVTIDSYLLPNVFPGTYLFVDPRGFAPDTRGYEYFENGDKTRRLPIDQFELSRYGVGGYYMATKVTNRIAEGEFSTQIIANWTAHIEKGRTSPVSTGDADIASNSQFTKHMKCGDRRSHAPEAEVRGSSSPTDSVGRNPDQ